MKSLIKSVVFISLLFALAFIFGSCQAEDLDFNAEIVVYQAEENTYLWSDHLESGMGWKEFENTPGNEGGYLFEYTEKGIKMNIPPHLDPKKIVYLHTKQTFETKTPVVAENETGIYDFRLWR